MRRGFFKEVAQTACDMVVGWRMADDLDRLVAAGEGVFEVDLLTAATRLDGEPVEPLRVSHEIHLWLRERLATEEVPPGLPESARLVVAFRAAVRTPRRPGEPRHVHLRFRCESTVVAGATYAATVTLDEGVRTSDGPRVVR